MILRLDMQAAASKAKRLLGDSADLVIDNIVKQLNPDGGFRGRTEKSDLYYTLFAVESLLALGARIPREHISNYLMSFGDGMSLDLVHLGCLIRCRADLELEGPADSTSELLCGCIEQLLHQEMTAYTCFFALGAYQDINASIKNRDELVSLIKSLRKEDGGFSNDASIKAGSTPGTAAAVTVLHYLDEPVDKTSLDWLLARFDSRGGFTAVEGAPVADLLSTATAIYALGLSGVCLEGIKEPCLDFIDGLWDSRGGFCGSEADRTVDCEYTYYGLLSLGHLSE